RAEVTAGAREQGSARLAADDPFPVRAFDRRDARAFAHLGPAPAEKVRVELAAQDPVADGTAVFGLPHRSPEHARAEARDGLEHARSPVLREVEGESGHDAGRDPARAHLVAGED